MYVPDPQFTSSGTVGYDTYQILNQLIHYDGVGRLDKMHIITTRQGVRKRGTTHWARVVADYGVALPGRQGWRCIRWPAAQHGNVEGVQADELMIEGGGHTS